MGKLAIFDCYGTVIETPSHQSRTAYVEQVCRTADLQPSPALISGLYVAALSPFSSLDQTQLRDLTLTKSFDPPSQLFDAAAFCRTIPPNVRYLVNRLYEEEEKRLGMIGIDLIKELHQREYEIAFISNANSWQYQALKTILQPLIAEVSGRLFASCRMGVAKPDPKLYAILNPNGYREVLYFGNSIRNDYLFALKARFSAFLVSSDMSLAKYQQIASCWL